MRDRPTAGREREDAPDLADAAMERYAAGDDCAFGAVYDAVAPRLHAYLLRQTRDPAEADDLLQQTLLNVHRARGTFISGSRVLPWAFAIARRLLIDRLRRRRLEASLSGDGEQQEPLSPETAEQTAAARELATRLGEELARLPASQRAAFELLRMEGLSHSEAAETLGVTVNAVKLRAHRAYLALHAVLEAILPRESEK